MTNLTIFNLFLRCLPPGPSSRADFSPFSRVGHLNLWRTREQELIKCSDRSVSVKNSNTDQEQLFLMCLPTSKRRRPSIVIISFVICNCVEHSIKDQSYHLQSPLLVQHHPWSRCSRRCTKWMTRTWTAVQTSAASERGSLDTCCIDCK